MLKYLVTFLVLIFGIKTGISYITSEDFQKYGDRTKAPWTCRTTMYVGHVYQLLDDPVTAKSYYDRIPARCPKTDLELQAVFESAYSIDQMDRDREALDAYNQFLTTYKDSTSPILKQAKKNVARIQGARNL